MPPETVKVSVIVISYNTREMTLECLRALADDMKGMPWELWVVDNASSDGSAEAVKETFPEARVIVNEHNAGFGAANNQAIRQAQGQYLLLVNSDAFVQPGAVEALVSHLDAHPGVAVVGPKLLNPDGSLQQSCYRFPSPVRAVFEHLLLTAAFPNHPLLGDYRDWPHDAARDVDFVIGACMLIRRESLHQTGVFDEDFFMYAEETDLCYRLSRDGWKTTFVPEARVVHLAGSSGRPESERTFSEFRQAQERFIRKHYGGVGLAVFRCATVSGAALRIVSFSILRVFRRARRAKLTQDIHLWWRILLWTLGLRGPGLKEAP